MPRILSSHFGGAAAAAAPASTTGNTPAPPSSSSSPPHRRTGGASSSSTRMLLSLCVFTCYWGIDETPVVVGLQASESSDTAAGPSGESGGSSGRGEGTSAAALVQQLRQLKVGEAGMMSSVEVDRIGHAFGRDHCPLLPPSLPLASLLTVPYTLPSLCPPQSSHPTVPLLRPRCRPSRSSPPPCAPS